MRTHEIAKHKIQASEETTDLRIILCRRYNIKTTHFLPQIRRQTSDSV